MDLFYFIEFVTILLWFYVLDFLPGGSLTGVQPAPPALESEVLTTEQPGKSLL